MNNRLIQYFRIQVVAGRLPQDKRSPTQWVVAQHVTLRTGIVLLAEQQVVRPLVPPYQAIHLRLQYVARGPERLLGGKQGAVAVSIIIGQPVADGPSPITLPVRPELRSVELIAEDDLGADAGASTYE